MTVLKMTTLRGVPVLFVSVENYKTLQYLPSTYSRSPDYPLFEHRVFDVRSKELYRVFIGCMVK